MPERPATLKVFLSHSYKSPEVNLYFFKIFHALADLHFEVDVGQKPICMTRLELMIQSADAFVGIYPSPIQRNVPPGKNASKLRAIFVSSRNWHCVPVNRRSSFTISATAICSQARRP